MVLHKYHQTFLDPPAGQLCWYKAKEVTKVLVTLLTISGGHRLPPVTSALPHGGVCPPQYHTEGSRHHASHPNTLWMLRGQELRLEEGRQGFSP